MKETQATGTPGTGPLTAVTAVTAPADLPAGRAYLTAPAQASVPGLTGVIQAASG